MNEILGIYAALVLLCFLIVVGGDWIRHRRK